MGNLLGDAANLGIIKFLRQRPESHIGQINAQIHMSRPVLSRRLIELEQAGVVVVDSDQKQGARKGQLLHYRVNEERLSALSGLWYGWLANPDS